MLTVKVLLAAATFLLAGCVDLRKLPGIKERVKQEDARATRETDEAIKSSPVFQELNRLCTEELPLPDGFNLVTKDRSIHTGPFLEYGYYSEADYQKVKSFYLDYFTRNGWRVADQKDDGWGPKHLEVRRGSHKVKIYHGGMGKEVNYKVHCGKLPNPEEGRPQ